MKDRYSEQEAIAAVARLTPTQLHAFVQAEVVTPVQTEGGVIFRHVDIVRLQLLCELSEEFDLDEDALGVVISLIDQLHGVRGDLHALLAALAEEPEEVRTRVMGRMRGE